MLCRNYNTDVVSKKPSEMSDSPLAKQGSGADSPTKTQSAQGKPPGKDLNFLEEKIKYKIPRGTYDQLCRQFQQDSEFLASLNIIDYSLILGVQQNEVLKSKYTRGFDFQDPKGLSKEFSIQPKSADLAVNSYEAKESITLDPKANLELEQGLSPITTTDKEWTLHFGVIDIFTNFGVKKKLEWAARRLLQGPGISCVPPDQYSERFTEFMSKKIFEPYDPPKTTAVSMDTLKMPGTQLPPASPDMIFASQKLGSSK